MNTLLRSTIIARSVGNTTTRSLSANAKVWVDKDTRVICQVGILALQTDVWF